MPRFEPFDWYEDALYYDIIFDADSAQEANFLCDVAEAHGRPGGRSVLEPACGSGRLLLAMIRRGWSASGFDLSDGMLRFARERLDRAGVRATVSKKSMDDFTDSRRYDLAHCLVSTFKYLRPESAAVGHLRRVADVLHPGGLYVVGLHLADYDLTKRQRERWVAERDGVHVVCNIQGWPPDRRTRLEQVRSRLTVTRPDAPVRRLESNWTFRTYDLRQMQATLREVPAFEHVATYDFRHDIECPAVFDGRQVDVVLVLRRRESDA